MLIYQSARLLLSALYVIQGMLERDLVLNESLKSWSLVRGNPSTRAVIVIPGP